MRLTVSGRSALCAVPLLLALSAVSAPAHAGVIDDTPETSWQVNGPVYASTVIGDTVYVGGRFTEVVDPKGQTQMRPHLAAFSASTGALLPWSPNADGVVWALEAQGDTVWAGGEFTSVGGRDEERLVKLSASTGAVDKKFDVHLNNTVRALEVDHGMLYVGGTFTCVNGKRQAYLTKVAATSGAVPGGFKPVLEDMVRAIVAPPAGSGNDLYVAGNFVAYDGVAQPKVALVNAANGNLKPFRVEKPATTRALDISPDGTVLFGAIGGDINSAVAWSTATGQRLWRHKVVGDVHEVTYAGGKVWTGFAEGALDSSTSRLQVLDAATGVADPTFAPVVNSVWGVRTIAVTATGVVVGGNFSTMEGHRQRYLAFFR
ncbi:MAG: hypothetical protein U0R80_16780 [Nocardioidaceae bacterium]